LGSRRDGDVTGGYCPSLSLPSVRWW